MTTTNDIIAVPGIAPDVAGAICYWRLSGATDLAKLGEEWHRHGIDHTQFPLPLATSPEVALHTAMQDQRERRVLVRPLEGRKGWAIVRERAQGQDLAHEIELRVHLDNVGSLRADRHHVLLPAIRAEFDRALNQYGPGATSGWLVKTIYRSNAVALRDTGGIYFVPRQELADWRRVVVAVRDASAHAVFEIPALRSSEAVDAVLDAVAMEAQAEADKMSEELSAGTLGARTLQSRSARCQEALEKVESYESLLGRGLDTIKARIDALKTELVAAALAAQD